MVTQQLHSIPLLSKLSSQQLQLLAGAMRIRHYEFGKDLLREGDDGNEFFILKSGRCDVLKHSDNNLGVDIRIAELKAGDYCGEAALLNNSKRAATIRSASFEGTEVYTLDRDGFEQLFGRHKALNITFAKRQAISAESSCGFNLVAASTTISPSPFSSTSFAPSLSPSASLPSSVRSSLSSVPIGARVEKTPSECALIASTLDENILFAHLAAHQREAIVAAMWLRDVAPGEEPIRQGDLGDYFYCVQDGLFDIFITTPMTTEGTRAEKKVATRGPGTSFGELALSQFQNSCSQLRKREFP